MKRWILLCFLTGWCLIAKAIVFSSADSLVLEKFWEYARTNKLADLSYGQRVVLIGQFFINKPYKAGTLNVPLEEMPVINLREFDCVTFVENTLALTFLNRYDKSETAQFVDNLIQIRYRKGKIESYISRLHYSSDWLYEMERQHILSDVTHKIGGIEYPLEVYFMTKNYRKYPILARDTVLVPEMKKIETAINKRSYYYIPKHSIRAAEKQMMTGDIVLITTNIKGLDTSHLGIAVKKEGRIYLLHASSTAKKIVCSEHPLPDYMADIASQTGIMVGRVNLVPGEDWIVFP